MGLNTFKSILRHLRFNDKDTSSVRHSCDKFAAIREIFDLVVKKLKKSYSSSERLTVDEQLAKSKKVD